MTKTADGTKRRTFLSQSLCEATSILRVRAGDKTQLTSGWSIRAAGACRRYTINQLACFSSLWSFCILPLLKQTSFAATSIRTSESLLKSKPAKWHLYWPPVLVHVGPKQAPLWSVSQATFSSCLWVLKNTPTWMYGYFPNSKKLSRQKQGILQFA